MKLNKLTFLLASILLLNGCQTKPQDVDYYSLNVTKTIQTLNAHACPSTGNVKALVVPVHFSDVEEEMDLDVITKAFNGSASEVDWYSVSDFYAQSSYQKLNFEFEITSIFTPSAPATYYENKDNFNGDGYNTNASRALYKEVLDYFDDQYDYSDYDSDGDGYIDCIYLIYDHEVDYTYANQFWWAYTASYVEDDVIDDVKLKNYIWCGYSFLKKDNQECNTHTLIHETAHLFGIDDYYDYYPTTGASKGGLAGGDLMDNDDGSPSGDHNSYTKSLLGWTTPTIITTKKEIEITLKAFQDSGDCIILANDFDQNEEMYQEYFILEYYTPTKLQAFDQPFSINGVRVLHVASQLENGHIKYNNSTSTNKLISQINTKNGDTYINASAKRTDTTLFTLNKQLLNANYFNNDKLNYQFEVTSLTDEEATIKITYSA